MQEREIRVLIVIVIVTLAPEAEPHGDRDPESQHHDHCEAHRRFVNQNLDRAHNQGDPGFGRVEVMDPFGIGFHSSKISLSGAKK